MLRILYIGGSHPKNDSAINKYNNIQIDRTSLDKLDTIDITRYHCVFSPSNMIDKRYIVNNRDIKFIFGPHFGVFPDNRFLDLIYPNIRYIVPSEWVKRCYQKFPVTSNLNIQVMPFGVDTEKFKPDDNITDKDKVVIYFKHRYYQELDRVIDFLNRKNIEVIWIFNYDNKYDENYYLSVLQRSKFGIWVSAHESQGFALQEALSCNVPLIVWNVRSMNQEMFFNNPDIPATTIPYWDERCGEYFYNITEMEQCYKKFIDNFDKYRPRDFILENLSIKLCEDKFIELIR